MLIKILFYGIDIDEPILKVYLLTWSATWPFCLNFADGDQNRCKILILESKNLNVRSYSVEHYRTKRYIYY